MNALNCAAPLGLDSPLRRSGEGPGEGSSDGAVRVRWVFIRIPYQSNLTNLIR